MSKEKMVKVKKSTETMYGARRLLVCGYPVAEQRPFLNFLQRLQLLPLPVVFVTDQSAGSRVKDLMDVPEQSGLGFDSGLSRAIIISGLMEEELHRLIGAYRKLGLPRQLWAALTPVSETWTLEQLLGELAAERDAIAKKRKTESSATP
jgi:hypothetical protein